MEDIYLYKSSVDFINASQVMPDIVTTTHY